MRTPWWYVRQGLAIVVIVIPLMIVSAPFEAWANWKARRGS